MKTETRIVSGYEVFLALLQRLGAELETSNDPLTEGAVIATGKCVLWEGTPDTYIRISNGEQTKEKRFWYLGFSHSREKIEDRLNWPTFFEICFQRHKDRPEFCAYKVEGIGESRSINGLDLLVCRAIGKILTEWVACVSTGEFSELDARAAK